MAKNPGENIVIAHVPGRNEGNSRVVLRNKNVPPILFPRWMILIDLLPTIIPPFLHSRRKKIGSHQDPETGKPVIQVIPDAKNAPEETPLKRTSLVLFPGIFSDS